MNFDFDSSVDRSCCGSDKYIRSPVGLKAIGADSYAGAEMDFKTAPVIIEALKMFVDKGIFGLTLSDDDNYLNHIVYWMKGVRSWDIYSDWIVPTYGTVSALNIALRAFTSEGDNVVVQSPYFTPYERLLRVNHRHMRVNTMKYENGRYTIDFEGLKEIMKEDKTKMLIFCNPHNPTTRIFNHDELKTVADMAAKYGVIIISDEIFAELAFDGKYVEPFARVYEAEENCLVCTSLGKAFNFVGTSHANVIIPSQTLRKRFAQQRDKENYGSLSPFMYTALTAAYSSEGKAWLDELIGYVSVNVQMVKDFFNTFMPQVKVCEHEGGCLLWVDWRGLGLDDSELRTFIEDEALIAVNYGYRYGVDGSNFTRIAIGTPHAGLAAALERLKRASAARKFIAV